MPSVARNQEGVVLLEVSQASSVFHIDNSSVKVKVSFGHSWDDTDRRKPRYEEKNLSQCLFVYHKSHMEWPGLEPGPPLQLEVGE